MGEDKSPDEETATTNTGGSSASSSDDKGIAEKTNNLAVDEGTNPPVDVVIDHSKDEHAEEQSLKLKDQGNKELLAGHYMVAIRLYSEALEFTPTSAIVLSNRAQAYIKVENYGLAINDATNAIECDNTYAKGYYRRASAQFALQKYKLAKKDFKAVCKLKPKDRDARTKLNECEKRIKEEAFYKAIISDETQPLSATYDPSKISVDIKTDYADGPHPSVDNTYITDPDLEASMFEPGKLPRQFVMHSIERFRNQKLIHKRYVARLLLTCKNYFESLSSLYKISIPDEAPKKEDFDDYNSDSTNNFKPSEPRVTVCGDTHGQYYDVLNIFNMNGYPSSSNPYLFNGDFVDRGSFSVEVILTFLLFKISDPNSIFLTRGNHETKNMNRIYGFEGEVKAKYDDKIFTLFLEVFCHLPLAATIENKIFVTHGGLSSVDKADSAFVGMGVSLNDIDRIKRGCEPPEAGLMSDLLWSDPQPFPGKSPSKRGVGYSFGPDITEKFLNDNDLNLLVRSHEVKEEGYLVEHDGKCITVFSAPNYCDTMGNKGAFIHFMKSNNLEPVFTQYTAVAHPEVRPMAYAAGMGGMF